MNITIPLQEALRPKKEFVESNVEKITRQIILVSKENIDVKIELENHLEKDFSDLPLVFDNLLPKFALISHESIIPTEKFLKTIHLMANKKEVNKVITAIEKRLYTERLKEKISLKKYRLSRLYLLKIRELAELFLVIFSSLQSKDQGETIAKTFDFQQKFKAKIDDYNIRILTFFALLFLLQEKNLIFEDDLFNKINLYAFDLSRGHNKLVNEITEAFK